MTDMPFFLRHWKHEKELPYGGNSILSRIDPLETEITDYWKEREGFEVVIFLSKRGLKKIQKNA